MYSIWFTYILLSFLFATTTLTLGVKNTVHSILFLILTFLCGSIILFSLNLEFFGIVFLVVYLGAIVVLFLFIIMMLELKILNTKQQIKDFFSYKNIYIYLLLSEILVILNKDFLSMFDIHSFINEFNYLMQLNNFENLYDILSNSKFTNFWSTINYNPPIRFIGRTLYCDYKFSFLLSGVILFISMIGSIVLTVEDYNFLNSKRQDAMKQGLRNPNHSLFNFKVFIKK